MNHNWLGHNSKLTYCFTFHQIKTEFFLSKEAKTLVSVKLFEHGLLLYSRLLCKKYIYVLDI